MIIDGISATELPERSSFADRATAAFLRFIERKLDVSVVRNARGVPDPALFEPLRLASLLQKTGVIKNVDRSLDLPDEPPMRSWYAICNNATSHRVGGTTWENDADALYAALAEALERYIWYTQNDYFIHPIQATVDDIRKKGSFIEPRSFAGFSDEQRIAAPEQQLREDAEYLWIKGTSLVKQSSVYLPAQVVSGFRSENSWQGAKEPIIRQSTTIGLATWPTQAGAQLAGANEVIEREAYMIMWLNQLTLPRLSLASLCSEHPSLARNVAACERYRLKTHVIQLLTDAPTHAIAVVMEDLSDVVPRFTIGLKAHRSLPFAVQKAMTEALRARRGCRSWFNAGNTWDMNIPAHEVGHRDRLYYWSMPEHAKKLEFLVRGPETEIKSVEWDNDSEVEHLQRIIAWCTAKEIECVSVSLGTSSRNPTPLHIEMIVMPELQPTYLTESFRLFGGTRWRSIPEAFGYTPLKKPFADAPHPFS